MKSICADRMCMVTIINMAGKERRKALCTKTESLSNYIDTSNASSQ